MNNFLVSFLARRKALAVYASVGMSKVQKKWMILIESISGGIVGALFGIVTTQLIIWRVTNLLGKIDISLNMDLTFQSAMLGMVGAVAVCLLSSISVLRRSGKVSIIEVKIRIGGAMSVVVDVKDVQKLMLGKEEVKPKELNFDIKQGEFVSLMGPSGSGKSTCRI